LGVLSMTSPAPGIQAVNHADFVLPPRHRLFAVFDDAQVGRDTVEWLRAEGRRLEDDIWIFSRQESLRTAGDGTHRWRRRAVRLVQRAMSSDYNYLELLDEALRQGGMVIAVKVPDEASADRLAKLLRGHAGRSFAYGAHWDFVPVAA
jgi:hypothetical protein